MSRAFAREGDIGEPIVVPPRPPLPPGTPNYVTPRGLALLRAELADLEAERASVDADRSDDAERTRRLNELATRRSDLAARIASAQVVEPNAQEEVRFGATVTLRTPAGDDRRFTIVGVDEAVTDRERVAFTAPIARAVLGKRVGDTVALRTPRGEEALTVAELSYDG